MFEQKSEAARLQGLDPTVSFMKSHYESAKQQGDRPGIRSQVEASIAQVKKLQAQQQELEAAGKTVNMLRAESTVSQVESGVLAEESTGALPPNQGAAETPAPAFQATEEGFITIAKRPPSAEPDIPTEMYQVPLSKDLETMPQWYKTTLVETEPLITRYDMVHDPLETKEVEKTEYYRPPVVRKEDRITNDDITGASAFDEVKIHKLKSLPELVDGYKPLPLFREVSKDGTLESAAETAKEAEDRLKYVDADGKPLKKSERLRRERQERLRKDKLQYDSDIMLPQLPWETDSVVDPYRGVEKTDAVDFNKENLEKTWKVYRTTFQQVMTEFGNLTQMTNEASCEKMLHDSMERFRTGDVGEHPEIHELQEEVFRLIFEAHTKHFLADYYKYKGNRTTESSAIKSEADEILRQASAKCKLLGQNFMNFIQEMTSLELDTIRKNPVQRYAIILRDKKFEPIAQPYMKWIKNELNEFRKNEFTSMEQLETHREFLVRHLNTARTKCPDRLEGISDAARDATVEGFYQWCRGALCFFGAKKLFDMYIHYADTRFRGKAEELFEDSFEWFSNYAKAGREVVQIPIPDCDPPYEYDEKEFLDGENGVLAEMSGLFDKAEGLWHGGSTKRWYPLIDETEYMWFNERRGRLTLAMDISDRCLENVNKKTHPSIHPFPERARVFLEGAPLTQETAEHLWLRYMGDLYWEHSLFMYRQGRYQMGRAYRDKCLNFYHLAVRTARERLPPSWKAPLLTEAKYLLRVYQPGEDTNRHLAEIDTVVAKLFAEREPRHWIDPFTELPFRLAIVQANLSAYGEHITKEVIRRLGWQPPNELLMKNIEHRARGGETLPELVQYFTIANEVADTVFRNKILQWRAKEVEGSDPHLYWTHLYFTFRVYPKDSEEVQRLWDMYEPAFLYIYTQAALATRMRGMRLLNVTIRQMSQVLLAGNREQQKLLLAELTKVRDKLGHMIDHEEMNRAINTLDGHLSDPASVPYIYGTALLYKEAKEQEQVARNPLLRSQLGSKDYKELQERIQDSRANSLTMNPQQAAKLQESQGSTLDEDAIGTQPDPSTKDMFN
ncbi:hypothetical protein STCU_03102 [Strigomonas culicis]|uniref:Uncharacterized protein n=1 Tax=Strigomonas culicis TaxID=28005 RepID=S9VXY5_9TRYP|nr:hypothetical protein STCU_03102 [Strigomonas culicis]|eukprot:EPY31921.1 hypothetical protein STCU_03102 [Strigomonas culicis]